MLTFTQSPSPPREEKEVIMGKPGDPPAVGALQELFAVSSFALDRDVEDTPHPHSRAASLYFQHCCSQERPFQAFPAQKA